MADTNNSTQVNVDIGATNSAKSIIQGAIGDFSELWAKVGEGKLATGVTIAGFAGLAIGISAAVKQSAAYQAELTKLVTTAGESEANLALVKKGIEDIATGTGTTLQQLTSGMYIVESAGYHGADGLTILKAAAQGAKAEGADLAKVTDAVTSAMRDYNIPAKDAADVTSKMVAAVGAGKSTFEQFTGSLHSVLPIAAASHISMNDVLGDLASMTVHGMSADQATQNLANAIRTLQSPSQSAQQYLAQIGINAADLSGKLSKEGLSGTLEDVSKAIMDHMGPSGKVLIDAFNQSKTASQDANLMISKMPANLQNLAKEYENGKISLNDYRKDLKDLPTTQANLMQQFASLEGRAGGFNNLLKAGGPTALTYSQALQKATGNATTMNVALMLTGENANYTTGAIKAVSKAHAEAGGNVEGWATIQKNFNQQLSQAKERFQVLLVQIGDHFLPLLTGILSHMDGISKAIGWIAPLVGGVLAVVMAMKTWQMVIKGVEMAQAALNVIMDMNPIVLAIMAVVGVALLIITHWNQVKQWFGDFVNWIKQHLMILLPIFFGVFGIAADLIISHWSKIVQVFKEVGSAIGKAFSAVGDAIGTILKTIGGAINQFITHFWHDIGVAIGFIIGLPIKIIEVYIGLQIKLIKLFLEMGLKAIEGVGHFLSWLIHIDWIGLFMKALDAFNNIIATLIVDGIKLFTGFINWITNINWSAMFKRIKDSVKDAVSGAGDWLYDAGKNLIDGLVKGLKDFGKNAINAVKDLGGGIASGFKSVLGIHSPSRVFADLGTNIGQGLIQGIDGIKAQANVAVTGLVTGSGLVNSNGTPQLSNQNSTTNNYSNVAGAQHTTTINVSLSTAAATQAFFQSLNQDSMNVSRGLTPVQGAY